MKKNTFKTLCLAILLTFSHVIAQAQTITEPADTLKIKYKSAKEFIAKSTWNLSARSFYMQTTNTGNFKNDNAMAQGFGIGLLTAPIKGFQFGISGYSVFKVFATDINQPDPNTNQPNRYELGLFDITTKSTNSLNRLEDLFLKYSFKQNSIKVGRMELETPFINRQDGRMRPTMEEGVWLNLKPAKKLAINGGYIWGISPRSTVGWYKIDESVGIYPVGVNTVGSKSNYKTNITSSGVFMVHIAIKPTSKTVINIWNSYFENVNNTLLLELTNEDNTTTNQTAFYQSLMLVKQNTINNGGSPILGNTYATKNDEAAVISSQLGLKNKKFNWNVNYTHITKAGRYLMPREWGKDPFYTFMPRERNEGMGNVHAFTTNFNYFGFHNQLKTAVGYGYYNLPSASNFELNKYAMPSYQQINFSSSYSFINFWKGIELKLLIAYKLPNNEEILLPKYIYNRVNLMNLNLIVDVKL